MRMFKQSHNNNCLLFAAAMVLDVEPKILIKEIGHDGSEIIWPTCSEPINRRGYHIQEIMDIFFTRGKLLVPIEILPTLVPYDQTRNHIPYSIDYGDQHVNRFLKYIENSIGIFCGETLDRPGIPHAVAWNGEHIYDPQGKIYGITDFKIREYWRVVNK